MEDITGILTKPSIEERKMLHSSHDPPPTLPISEAKAAPPAGPSATTDPVETTLLFNITTQKLTYITMTELRALSAIKRVSSIYIPMWAHKLDIYTGGEGLGTSGCLSAGTVRLPLYVMFWRLFGWWERVWLVEGEEV
ncbi:hypothetical protein EG329_004075 [Mollisiaceae sp. DMI_Dod_QoI]|nr:hypothetical protein EG329_004075 [Helotiales sp. DMI_Dod_QoI]